MLTVSLVAGSICLLGPGLLRLLLTGLAGNNNHKATVQTGPDLYFNRKS